MVEEEEEDVVMGRMVDVLLMILLRLCTFVMCYLLKFTDENELVTDRQTYPLIEIVIKVCSPLKTNPTCFSMETSLWYRMLSLPRKSNSTTYSFPSFSLWRVMCSTRREQQPT